MGDQFEWDSVANTVELERFDPGIGADIETGAPCALIALYGSSGEPVTYSMRAGQARALAVALLGVADNIDRGATRP